MGSLLHLLPRTDRRKPLRTLNGSNFERFAQEHQGAQTKRDYENSTVEGMR